MRPELPDTATISLWPINRQNLLNHRMGRLSRRTAQLSRRRPTLAQPRNLAPVT